MRHSAEHKGTEVRHLISRGPEVDRARVGGSPCPAVHDGAQLPHGPSKVHILRTDGGTWNFGVRSPRFVQTTMVYNRASWRTQEAYPYGSRRAVPVARARALSRRTQSPTCLFETLSGPRVACHSRTSRTTQCLRRVLAKCSLNTCNAIDRPRPVPPPAAVRLCLGSVSASAVYLFHLRPDTHSRLSVPSTSPAPSRLSMWSHRQESIYDDELSSRGPAPARAPRVSASARGRCDRIVFHRTPARHRRDSRHARRVARSVSISRTQRGQCVARPVDGEALWGVGVSVAV